MFKVLIHYLHLIPLTPGKMVPSNKQDSTRIIDCTIPSKIPESRHHMCLVQIYIPHVYYMLGAHVKISVE